MLSDVVALLAPLAEKRLRHFPDAFESLSGLLGRVDGRGNDAAIESQVDEFAQRVNHGVAHIQIIADSSIPTVDGLIEKLRRSL